MCVFAIPSLCLHLSAERSPFGFGAIMLDGAQSQVHRTGVSWLEFEARRSLASIRPGSAGCSETKRFAERTLPLFIRPGSKMPGDFSTRGRISVDFPDPKGFGGISLACKVFGIPS